MIPKRLLLPFPLPPPLKLFLMAPTGSPHASVWHYDQQVGRPSRCLWYLYDEHCKRDPEQQLLLSTLLLFLHVSPKQFKAYPGNI